MKKVEIKLDQVVKLLSFANFPNKQELLNGYETLKKLFNSSFPQEALQEIIRGLRANPFYRQFKLDADPYFLKALINKVNDFEIIEQLLKSSEIHYSEQEEMVLEQRLNILISLSLLDQDLKEAKVPVREGQIELDRVFEVYFGDLEKLKQIFLAETISIENINWFFKSNLFDFISRTSDCFDVKLTNLYEVLLEGTEINTKQDFIEHKNILIEKASYARRNEDQFDYLSFSSILGTEKNCLGENRKRNANHLNQNSFYKPPKVGASSQKECVTFDNKFEKIESVNKNNFKH